MHLEDALSVLTQPGMQWSVLLTGIHMLASNRLLPKARLWVYLVKKWLNPTTHDKTISRDKVMATYYIAHDIPINVGRLIMRCNEDIATLNNLGVGELSMTGFPNQSWTSKSQVADFDDESLSDLIARLATLVGRLDESLPDHSFDFPETKRHEVVHVDTVEEQEPLPGDSCPVSVGCSRSVSRIDHPCCSTEAMQRLESVPEQPIVCRQSVLWSATTPALFLYPKEEEDQFKAVILPPSHVRKCHQGRGHQPKFPLKFRVLRTSRTHARGLYLSHTVSPPLTLTPLVRRRPPHRRSSSCHCTGLLALLPSIGGRRRPIIAGVPQPRSLLRRLPWLAAAVGLGSSRRQSDFELRDCVSRGIVKTSNKGYNNLARKSNMRCQHCAGPLSKDMETSAWTTPPLIRDSFSMIGSAVGGTASAFYGFNNVMPVVQRSVKGPMWLHFLIGAPPVIVFSSACAGMTGGAVPALAQLVASSYHSLTSSSKNVKTQDSKSSSTL
ncbi:uncharacterized protein LOC120073695 [Benincasa hispida]|uniref:uncharacterized protein LOC120073695 n=1 Tax=Benincasa hispida TaxID=102211 RepID=UPI001901B34F|nr:uncharacterized protein LOC120073695 [Benincasa hispida]